MPLKCGNKPPSMLFRRQRNFTANYFIQHTSFRRVARTSQASNASWQPNVTSRVSRSVHLKAQILNLIGGCTHYHLPFLLALSQLPPNSRTPAPSLMQAPERESRFWLAASGRHGDSSQDGNQTVATSHGPKQSPLNSWLVQSWQSTVQPRHTNCTATTGSLLMAGQTGVHATNTSTLFSAAYTTSLMKPTAVSSPDMYRVPSTQPMAPPEVGSPYIPPASHQSTQTHPSPTSSSMPPSLELNKKSTQFEREQILLHYSQPAPPFKHGEMLRTSATESTKAPHTSGKQTPTRTKNRWHAPLPPRNSTSSVNKYPIDLTPNPSPLRPMCASADRLHLWRPACLVASVHLPL